MSSLKKFSTGTDAGGEGGTSGNWGGGATEDAEKKTSNPSGMVDPRDLRKAESEEPLVIRPIPEKKKEDGKQLRDASV